MTSTMQPENNTSIYMIAIVPPEPLYSEIQQIKEYVGNTYKTKEALRRPPHITLIPPFNATVLNEQTLRKFVDMFGGAQMPFDIMIDGFGEFSQKTLFIKPAESPEIMGLQKTLSKQFSSVYHRGASRGPSYGFHPHITIGYQDLSRPMFEAAWREFGNKLFRRRFTLDHICLMRWDYGWKIIHKGLFNQKDIGKSEELTLFA